MALFQCGLEPVGDPTLRFEWLHNGHPIPYSNRIHMANELGCVTLDILHLIAEDSGEYKCVAKNAKGTAETTGHITVQSLIETEAPKVVAPLVETIDEVLPFM